MSTADPSRASELESLLAPVVRKESRLRRGLTAASYPFRGVGYFVTHRELWPIALGRLLPLTLLSFAVYFVLFAFAFLPQVALLAIFQGWAAWAGATFLVLGEGLVIIQALFEAFFVDKCLVDVWDAVFIENSLQDMIAPHRELNLDAPDAVKMLGKHTTPAVFFPFSFKQIFELVFFLPLNLIPVVGVPLFIVITGSRLGKLSHYRWFKLRGINKKQRKMELKRRLCDYTCFGTVAMMLQLVPVLSFFFLITSAVGASLWAAKLEKERQEIEQGRRARQGRARIVAVRQ
ncbi:hypothetical protein Cpir12675_004593 [Ceratocystis pirilliformis]|uniref:Outer spore wall protein RRT8 n=1 Tax=Ceratocystis pirilliformis TaxID=259994 RepID=A0ABR3YVE9_9PEZI